MSHALKERSKGVKVYLVDPPGSGLYNKVTRGVMFTKQEAEQRRLKNPSDTITEGVGINRVTKNFARCGLDYTFSANSFLAQNMQQQAVHPIVV